MKKRLLGAAVLIALAVIFVPMLLPGNPGPGSDSVGLKIPPPPSSELQTRVLEVGPNGASAGSSTAVATADPDKLATLDLDRPHAADQVAATGATAQPAPLPETPAASREPETEAAAQQPEVARTESKPKPEPEPPPAPKPAEPKPVPGGAGAAAGAVYTVNLGIYANHASADALVKKARDHGFTALATPETYQGKSVSRVRVGPFSSRAEAEAARLKLKGFEPVASMTVEAATVDQKGDAPSSALPSGQPGAWAVQLAAFSDQSSADKMRDRLHDQGFDGYVDSVTTSKGKLWRVRAGPYASREVATRTRDQIAQKLKVSGNVVTQH